MRGAAILLAAGLATAAAAADDPFADRWDSMSAARLEALDKVTGRVSMVELPLEERARFGTLLIQVFACHRRPPEFPPDAAALLEIVEQRRDDTPIQPLFRGWMFASSPSLSALEHPVYDVIVRDCVVLPEARSGSHAEGGADSDSE